ncbi:MAG TPA: head GIN domain-containing protein [Anaeromyxobacter sp.]|nr:head GIN domain-containing protein [Anaeromyxobacter sp.]
MDRGTSGQRRPGTAGLLGLVCGLLAAGEVACQRSWPRTIEGDGKTITQVRPVGGPFDAVDARGAMDLQVKVEPAASIAVTIDQNLQPYVDVHIEGSTLVIEQHDSLRWHDRACANVTLPVLRAVSTSGWGVATVEGSTGGALLLSSTGSGDVRWRGEAERLEVRTSGSGRVVLAGRAADLRVSTSGSGNVEGSALTVSGDADVSTSGSGSVELALAGGSLQAHTSGSGDVTYSGEARAVNAQVSGSGRVRRR